MRICTDMGVHEGGMENWAMDNAWVKFANIVEAHEREECAKIVDKRLSNWASSAGKDKAYKWLEKLAEAIRARGKT